MEIRIMGNVPFYIASYDMSISGRQATYVRLTFGPWLCEHVRLISLILSLGAMPYKRNPILCFVVRNVYQSSFACGKFAARCWIHMQTCARFNF